MYSHRIDDMHFLNVWH